MNIKGDDIQTKPVMYFFKDKGRSFYVNNNLEVEPESNEEFIPWFEGMLATIIDQMLNPEIEFSEMPAFESKVEV